MLLLAEAPSPVQTGIAWLFALAALVWLLGHMARRRRKGRRGRWGGFGRATARHDVGNPEKPKARPTLVRLALTSLDEKIEASKAPKAEAKNRSKEIRRQNQRR